MSKFNSYPNLFQPYKVGKMELKNRLIFSPVVSGHASLVDGAVTNDLIEFVGAQARTGVSMVHIGSTPVDFGRGRDFFGCLGNTRETDVIGIQKLSDEVHRYDCKFSIELVHAGRMANPISLAGRKAYVPWLTPDMDPDKFIQVGEDEMEEVIALFEQAALRLVEARVDQALIHGAHGNFVSAWLSPLSNQRDDEYGGSLENRARFPLRLLKRVREAVGDRINIDYRISQNEYAQGSPTLEEIIDFLKMASVYIDSAFCSGGWMFHEDYRKYQMPTYLLDRCINIPRTAVITQNVDIPIVCVGNIPSVEAAEAILAEGKADIVAMARNILSDMEYVKKAYRGESDRIRPCIRCTECVMRPGRGLGVRCSVNPMVGQEHRYPFVPKANVKKKVVIIGGGPAGMTAAQYAVKRGHDVVLYEKENEVGGRLKEASASFSKVDHHKKYLPWMIRETHECGAKVICGIEATPEIIAKENPDAIIVACGGEQVVPPIPGIDSQNVITVTEADLRLAPIGDNIVIIGGGIAGLECGIDLCHDGKRVTIIDVLPEDKLWREEIGELRSCLVDAKVEYGVALIDEARVTAIKDGCVEYEKTSGEKGSLSGDTFVNACGIAPNRKYIDTFKEIIPEVYVIGDAQAEGNIHKANHNAFNVAIEL